MVIKSERDLFNEEKIKQLPANEKLFNALAVFCDCTKVELLRALYSRCREKGTDLVYSKTIHDAKERTTQRGYYKRRRLIKNKQREITTPNIHLQKVQDGIYKRLDVVPVSLKSTGGKKGDSPENHAELHRDNRYVSTMDIQNAYPSVDAARVLENIRGVLLKPIGMWFPTLPQGDKEELLRCIVFLTVSQNQLPQGVSTSDKIINIVFAKSDERVQAYLERQPHYLNARYSRYKDDLAVSYAANSTIIPLLTILHTYKRKIDALFASREHLYDFEILLDKTKELRGTSVSKRKPTKKEIVKQQPRRDDQLERASYTQAMSSFSKQFISNKADIESLKDTAEYKALTSIYSQRLRQEVSGIGSDFDQKKMGYLLQIRGMLVEIITSGIVLSNTQEGKIYQNFYKGVLNKLVELREKHVFKREGQEDYKDDMYKNIYAVIGEIQNLSIKHFVKSTGKNIDSLTDHIMSILSSEGRHVNPKKTKKRTPSSSNLREITGVAFNEKGDRMLPTSKRNEYIRIFTLLNRAPVLEQERLDKNKIYREFIINGRVDVEHIKSKITGIRGRIKHVYEERDPPRDLLRWYEEVRERRRDQGGLFHPLEERFEYLPEHTLSDSIARQRKVDELRVDEIPMSLKDHENIPFPSHENIPFPSKEDETESDRGEDDADIF